MSLFFVFSLCMLVLYLCLLIFFLFFFKQKTAYEMRISDWSSDVCSSDLTSSRCAASTVSSTVPPPLPDSAQAIGTAAALAKRETGWTPGSRRDRKSGV